MIVVLAVVALTAYIIYACQANGGEAATATPEYATKLFDKDKVMEINIEIDEDEWQDMLDNATDEQYILCNVAINGETCYDVGIRPKGNTSLSAIASDDTTDRFSFKVEFDHYINGQTFMGLDKMALNNIYADATYMKEYLSYDLMNYLGVDTPLYSYCNITVNGEPWGFYLAIEGVEESFVERNYGDNGGSLYKPESMGMGGGANANANADTNKAIPDMSKTTDDQQPQSTNSSTTETKQSDTTSSTKKSDSPASTTTDIQNNSSTSAATNNTNFRHAGGGMGDVGGGSSSGADLVYTDDDIDSYSTIFDNNVIDDDKDSCKRVIEALQHLQEGTDLDQYFDVDEILAYIAGNCFVVNLDSYFGSMLHNYYLYEQDGQISIIPWDYNLAFGGFNMGAGMNSGSGSGASSTINLPIDTPVTSSLAERPLVGQLLADQDYSEQYHQDLYKVLDYADQLDDEITKIDALIGDYVASDPTAFYDEQEYNDAVAMLMEFCKLRAKSIEGQLNGKIPSTAAGQQADSANLINTDAIDLSVMGTMSTGGGMGNMTRRGNNSISGTIKSNQTSINTTSQTDNKSTLSQAVVTSDTNTATTSASANGYGGGGPPGGGPDGGGVPPSNGDKPNGEPPSGGGDAPNRGGSSDADGTAGDSSLPPDRPTTTNNNSTAPADNSKSAADKSNIGGDNSASGIKQQIQDRSEQKSELENSSGNWSRSNLIYFAICVAAVIMALILVKHYQRRRYSH